MNYYYSKSIRYINFQSSQGAQAGMVQNKEKMYPLKAQKTQRSGSLGTEQNGRRANKRNDMWGI